MVSENCFFDFDGPSIHASKHDSYKERLAFSLVCERLNAVLNSPSMYQSFADASGFLPCIMRRKTLRHAFLTGWQGREKHSFPPGKS